MYQPTFALPSFPLRKVSELDKALLEAKDVYEQRIRTIFDQFIDIDKLKSDHELFVAIEQYAREKCPIDRPVKNIQIVEFLNKDPLSGGLNIIGGILPSNGHWLGRIFQPGLYHSVDTTWYYGGSGCLEESHVANAEKFTRLLDDTSSRVKIFAAIKTIIAK